MPNSAVLLLAFGIAGAIFAGMLTVTSLLGPKRPNPVKAEPFECGAEPSAPLPPKIDVKFYLVAMLFIVFDIETIFLYPWAVLYKELQLFGLVEMGLFIFILLFGYLYIWRKGGFEWK